MFIDVEGWFENVVKEITIYESFDGTRFDSLNDAENYEEGLKNQAIRSLCNHDYDAWEDYMFTRSREPDWKLNLFTTPLNSRSTHTVTISNKKYERGVISPLSISFPNSAKVAILLFRDGEWSKKFHKPSLLDFWSNPSVCLLGVGKHYKKLNKKLISKWSFYWFFF